MLYFLSLIIMKAFVTLASLSLILVSCSLYQKTTPTVETPETPEATIAPATETSTEQTTGVDANTTKETPITAPEKTTETSKVTTPEPTKPTTKSYTAAEVATHSTASSCWLILDAKVYDVTKFIPSHPGGNEILKGCGKDATKMFSRHPESAKAMKEQFYIGDLKA